MTKKCLIIITLSVIILSSCDKNNDKDKSNITKTEEGNVKYQHSETSEKTKSIKTLNSSKKEILQKKRQSKLSLKKEKATCIIKKIEHKNDHYLITVDFIILECGKDESLDYCNIINTNPQLRTYTLSNELFNTEKEALESCDICLWNIKVSKGSINSIDHFVLS